MRLQDRADKIKIFICQYKYQIRKRNFYKVATYFLLMEFNLSEIEIFLLNPTHFPMPEAVRGLILSGNTLRAGNLESQVIEWHDLKEFSHEIAEKIDAPTEGYNIPVLRRIDEIPLSEPITRHFVYEPRTGEYLGQF